MSIEEKVAARILARECFDLCVEAADGVEDHFWKVFIECLQKDELLPKPEVIDRSKVPMSDDEKREFEKRKMPLGSSYAGIPVSEVDLSYLVYYHESSLPELGRYLKHPEIQRLQEADDRINKGL